MLLLFDKQTLFAAVNTHYTDWANVLMYYTTWIGEGLIISVILFLLLILVPSFRNWWYFVTALLCASLPALVSQWVKHWHNMPRPLNYFNKASWIHIMPDWPVLMKNSFPSGHTTGAFSLMCFLSLMLPAKYRAWGLLLFCVALMVAYSRLYLAAHFFEDVYAGSIIGGSVTLLIYTIMKHYQPYFSNKKLLTAKPLYRYA